MMKTGGGGGGVNHSVVSLEPINSRLDKILRYTSSPVEGGVVFVFNPKVAKTYNEAAGQDKFGKWSVQGRSLVLYDRVIFLSSYVPALEEGYLSRQRWR